MNFIHDAPDFEDLLSIEAAARNLTPGFVEKDYWVTHTLWALHDQGFEVWFKGGTSLSKGFALIERFSEDLDLKVEPGSVGGLRKIENWTSTKARAVRLRRDYFTALGNALKVPGAAVEHEEMDKYCRGANLRVLYPSQHRDSLGMLRPYVLLELGSARVTPFVKRDMSSFVHDRLQSVGLASSFIDNRPLAVRCVHPLVTLIEKLDAVKTRMPKTTKSAATFVRHFEDAARIARANAPPLVEYVSARELAEEMHEKGQIDTIPHSSDDAFNPLSNARWREVEEAHAAIEPMFWGDRQSIDESCKILREWIAAELS